MSTYSVSCSAGSSARAPRTCAGRSAARCAVRWAAAAAGRIATSGTLPRTRSRRRSASRLSASGARSAGRPGGCATPVRASAASYRAQGMSSRRPSRTLSARWTRCWPRPAGPAETPRAETAARGTAARGTAARGTAARGTAARGTAARGTAARGTVLARPVHRLEALPLPARITVRELRTGRRLRAQHRGPAGTGPVWSDCLAARTPLPTRVRAAGPLG